MISLRKGKSNSGWTLLEVSMASLLVTVVMGKAVFVMRSALTLASEESAALHYEDQARMVIDRIALAIMGSDREALLPQIEEVHSNSVIYRFSLGMEDGLVVWSPPEQIRLGGGGTEVEWLESPGAAEERQVIWTNMVSPLLEGEIINGVDDNGNGLIDEDGLSFVVDGQRVIIRLTIQRPELNGRSVQETVESIVTCRN